MSLFFILSNSSENQSGMLIEIKVKNFGFPGPGCSLLQTYFLHFMKKHWIIDKFWGIGSA